MSLRHLTIYEKLSPKALVENPDPVFCHAGCLGIQAQCSKMCVGEIIFLSENLAQ